MCEWFLRLATQSFALRVLMSNALTGVVSGAPSAELVMGASEAAIGIVVLCCTINRWRHSRRPRP